MDASPYSHVEERYALEAALLEKATEELDESTNKERKALQEKANIEQGALKRQTEAKKRAIRQTQNGKLKALQQRHKQELTDHETETEMEMQAADNEALEIKNALQEQFEKAAGDVELKLQQKTAELTREKKVKEEEVARMALAEVKKRVRVRGSTASNFRVSGPPVEATASISQANTLLQPPLASPITPLVIDPASATTICPEQAGATPSSRIAISANVTVGTPQGPPSRVPPKKPTDDTRKPASNAPFNTQPSTPLKEATSDLLIPSTPTPALRSTRNSICGAPCKGHAGALWKPPTAGTPKPESMGGRNSFSDPPRKEPVPAPSRNPNASPPKPGSTISSTPQNEPVLSLPKTPMARMSKPASKDPRNLNASTPFTNPTPPTKEIATPRGATDLQSPGRPPKTITKTSRAQDLVTIKSEGDASDNNALSATPRDDEHRRTMTTPKSEKRKNVSGQSGFSPKPRRDIYQVPQDDHEGSTVSSGDRPAKRAKPSLPVRNTASSRPEDKKLVSPQKENARGLSHSPAGRRKITGQAAAQRSAVPQVPAGQLRQPMSPRVPDHREIMPQPQVAPPDHGDNFNIDRACYPGTGEQLHSWTSKEDPRVHQLRLERGMFRPYVDNVIGDARYFAWMINPTRIRKLEYCTEQRLVKITKNNGDDIPDTYICFGLNRMADFVDSVREGWPDISVVKFDASEMPLKLLLR